jgi:hypothetical protein
MDRARAAYVPGKSTADRRRDETKYKAKILHYKQTKSVPVRYYCVGGVLVCNVPYASSSISIIQKPPLLIIQKGQRNLSLSLQRR